jgi:hypothetical protein
VVELWDGAPPAATRLADQVREPIRLRLPTGRLRVLHLPPGEAGREEIHNGVVPATKVPPGDYYAILSKQSDEDADPPARHLVQLWPAEEADDQ